MFELIIKAIDKCRNAPEDKLRLVSHVMASFTTLSSASGVSYQTAESTLDELARVGVYMTDIGRLQEEYTIKKYILKERRRILGEEHPSTISAMNNLASTLGDLGQWEEESNIKKEVVEQRRRILGEEHPDTITVMNNLASTLGDLGQQDEAIALLEECVHKIKRICVDEHPHLVVTTRNLNRLKASAVTDEVIAVTGNKGICKRSSLYGRLKRRLRRKAL